SCGRAGCLSGQLQRRATRRKVPDDARVFSADIDANCAVIAGHSASSRAFTPVFDGLWTRVNGLMTRPSIFFARLLVKNDRPAVQGPRVTRDVADDRLDEKTSIALDHRYPVVI